MPQPSAPDRVGLSRTGEVAPRNGGSDQVVTRRARIAFRQGQRKATLKWKNYRIRESWAERVVLISSTEFPSAPTLVVAGVVGPTIHGQGPSAGRRCSVIQMGGCNLSCSWCDSAFTWDSSRFDLSRELAYWPVEQVAAHALACAPSMVVISGGEPLLQQNAAAWPMLLHALAGHEIGLETNGTVPPTDLTVNSVSWITVSPKLAHSGDPAWARINGEALVAWGRLAVDYDIDFSFVVRDISDVSTIGTLATIHDLPPSRVWVTPEGTTAEAVLPRLRDVSDAALTAGFNLSARLNALVTAIPQS
jgi:7-carboxy-7-deazaguanine synthase